MKKPNPRLIKNRDRCVTILAQLREAQKIAIEVDYNSADTIIGCYSLSRAIERFESLRITCHVGAFDKLPESP